MTERAEYISTDDGVRLFVQVAGSGREAVMIPNRIYMAGAFARLAERRLVIFSDPRNRGASDQITDVARMERGVHHDVEDFDAIRRHFGIERLNLIGHSYMGLAVVLYAMKYPQHVRRVVSLGPVGPEYFRQYPAELTNHDATLADVFARLGTLQAERASYDPREFCKKFWSVLRPLYVLDPKDADALGWEPCDVPNELVFMKPWMDYVMPSIQRLQLTSADMAKAKAPVLVVHGRKDRSSAYGGGRDWALRLPNARLLTIERAAHVPWIEEPNAVFGAIETFLDGEWPAAAEKVCEDG